MSSAGALSLRLVWDGRRVTAVDVTSTRSRAAQLLTGKPVAMALELLPLLYSVCGRAQSLAGHAAAAAAQGHSAATGRSQSLAVTREATQEHLWRLLLDWPRLLGLTPLETEFSTWYRRFSSVDGRAASDFADEFVAFVEAVLLGMPLATWFALETPDELMRNQALAGLAGRLWSALPDEVIAGTDTVDWLPNCSAAAYAQTAEVRWDEDFERCPEWRGQAAETGALARWKDQPLVAATLVCHGRGVRARLLARLMDLAQCTRYIVNQDDIFAGNLLDAHSPVSGIGIARVETARGTLLHRLRLEGEGERQIVAEYAIVAPTEWNFQARGAFVAALRDSAASEAGALRERGLRLALALDPCVPYEVEIVEIEHA